MTSKRAGEAKRTSKDRPKVSVVTTTHNQEAYVRDAFDSFIAQQVDFPMEIVVADDASTDSTPEIIQEYTDRYPQLFRPIFRPKNRGLNRNLVGALSAARGTYIALCEGDDFWIDPLKLSKQVAFLDRHPQTAVCFHPVRVIWEDGRKDDSEFPPVDWRHDLTVEALIKRNFIQTNSAVYRRLPRYSDIPAEVMPLDWYLHVRHAMRGDIAMLPDAMAVYRRHSEGMWLNRVVDTSKFWLELGGRHTATFDAMIDLAEGDSEREGVIGEQIDWIFRNMANIPGAEGRAALLDSVARYPRSAVLALQYLWARQRNPLDRVESDPDDGRAVLDLAQHYLDLRDVVNARKWYERRIEMGGFGEEVYYSMYRIAELMAQAGEPWPSVEDAYLKAWQFRSTRAEPLYAIAKRYREDQRYLFAYQFAQAAAEIPQPELETLPISADVYSWRAADEQAICAAWIGKHTEAFGLCRRLLARPDIPDADRRRIAANRDFSAPAMIKSALAEPDPSARPTISDAAAAEVTVTLITGPDRQTTEHAIDSFLNCCLDVPRVGRFLVLDTGLNTTDRSKLQKRYKFLEFARPGPADTVAAQMSLLRAHINGRFWLHLGADWRFFAPENLISRLTGVLDADSRIFQVGVNFADAAKLTGASANGEAVRHEPGAGRFVLAGAMASGPAMFDIARLDRAIGARNAAQDDPQDEDERTASDKTARTACLDEVLCIAGRYLE